MLASLNHPNIAQIYGLEDSGNVTALVLELVEGPTLADRIAEGAIPVDEALAIAKQVAVALEAAHEQGIIHRHLKPANIKVTPDGVVKVLDFGLAKALESERGGDASESPTIATAVTGMGMIMGTAAYMSPEQARGKPVDRRADIWDFGVLVLEMLTGKRVFDAEDVSLTLAEVMKSEPDWQALPDNVSPVLRIYLERCLRKDPRSASATSVTCGSRWRVLSRCLHRARVRSPKTSRGRVRRSSCSSWTQAGRSGGKLVRLA